MNTIIGMNIHSFIIGSPGEECQQAASFDHPNGVSSEKQVYDHLTSMPETVVLP